MEPEDPNQELAEIEDKEDELLEESDDSCVDSESSRNSPVPSSEVESSDDGGFHLRSSKYLLLKGSLSLNLTSLLFFTCVMFLGSVSKKSTTVVPVPPPVATSKASAKPARDPIECHVCGKICKTPWGFKRHLAVHNLTGIVFSFNS